MFFKIRIILRIPHTFEFFYHIDFFFHTKFILLANRRKKEHLLQITTKDKE